MTAGIVVEGERDRVVYEAFIKRIRPQITHVVPIPCAGVSELRKRFVNFLKVFQWGTWPVPDGAFVIRDSDCKPPAPIEAALDQVLKHSGFVPTFRVFFFATKCETETWLLADESAVNAVAHGRRKAKVAQFVPDPLEGIPDAKERFARMLSQADLPADPAVYREIAESADIARIEARCPYFREFVRRVHAI